MSAAPVRILTGLWDGALSVFNAIDDATMYSALSPLVCAAHQDRNNPLL
jgi:hypothetical protein